MNELDETDDGRVVAAVKEYMRMLEEGNAPDREAYLKHHAEIADELRPSLEGLALVHQASEPTPAEKRVAPNPEFPNSELAGSEFPHSEFPHSEFPHSEFTAQPIGDFQIVGELGRGGMGVVYEAIQLSLGRHVALKVLPFASALDEVRLQRFRNEAHAAAALHHTNIVPVYAVGSDRGVHYYAMQRIDGCTLAELIENMRSTNSDRGDRQPSLMDSTIARYSTVLSDNSAGRRRYYKSVVRMIHQAALAIEHAHQYGVVHRDIKPANLLLDSAGKIWVTDFGLAQVQNEATQLTRTGDPMGTLRYMSPEQATGRRDELDHRTDIYSLGVTLYELLTLRPAITGDSVREMLNHVALHEPPSPRSLDPLVPVELDTIVRKAIEKSPSERYPSASALADDLQAWLEDKPIAAKPPTLVERLAKWRRRNSGLVAVASGFLLLATLGLFATTLLIWKEQRQTAEALERETQQRLQAQRSFQQAREAVDTFSNLSESQMAYRPDLQDLRRSFLETSLDFYQDFLKDRAGDPMLAKELETTSARVAEMVDELRILEKIAPLRALVDQRVQRELGIAAEDVASIEAAVEQFNEQRQSLANRFVGGLNSENNDMTQLAQDFNEFITNKLSADQMRRLNQLVRQERLPFTFNSPEVVAALELTRQQREEINRIILETAPRRMEGPRGGGGRVGPPGNGPPRDGPPRGGPPGFGGPRRPDGAAEDRFRFGAAEGRERFDGPLPGGPGRGGPGPGGPGPGGPGPGGPPHDRFDDSRLLRFDRAWSTTTQNTVQQILGTLSPEQRTKWDELVGEPFEG